MNVAVLKTVLTAALLIATGPVFAAAQSCADRYRVAYEEAIDLENGQGTLRAWINSSKLKAAHSIYAIYIDTKEGVYNALPAKTAITAALSERGVSERTALFELVRQMDSGELCTKRGGTLSYTEVIDSLEKALAR